MVCLYHRGKSKKNLKNKGKASRDHHTNRLQLYLTADVLGSASATHLPPQLEHFSSDFASRV